MSNNGLKGAAEVLKIVGNGFDRDTLNRWRTQGYIIAERVGKVWAYPDFQTQIIKQVWSLVKEGYSPRRAFEKINNDEEKTETIETTARYPMPEEAALLERMHADYKTMPFPDFLKKYKFE